MKFPLISKRPWKNIDLMICGTLSIVEGLVVLSSLGFKRVDLTMDYLCWRSDKMLERVKHENSH